MNSLRKPGHWLAVLIAVAAGPVSAATTADVEVLEQRVDALLERIGQLEQSSARAAAAPASELKVNGFMSAGFGAVLDDEYNYEGLSKDVMHNVDSILGVQLEARVNPDTRAVVQLAARGASRFSVDAEWAYVGMRAGGGEVRVGRQRFPFFMLSEYLEVGYAHPWAVPPVEVYQPGMPTSFDGLSWKKTLNAGDWSHELHTYWGSSTLPIAGSTGSMSFTDNLGLGVLTSAGQWTFSGIYSQGVMNVTHPLFDALEVMGLAPRSDDTDAWYAGVGVQYDNDTLVVQSEATRIEVPGYFPDSDAAYLTLGWRVGPVMPHVTWSQVEIKDSAERLANPALPALCAGVGLCVVDTPPTPFPADTLARMFDVSQESVTVGVRYEPVAKLAIKVDWTRVLDTNGTFGNFDRVDGNLFYGAKPTDAIDMYRVVFDVVF